MIVNTISEMREYVKIERAKGKRIGFVPTMGFLHEGHAALLKQAWRENDIVILSIFVNPTQFGPDEDYKVYPRDLARDQAIANENSVDYIFTPSVEEMYETMNPFVSVVVQDRVDILCGKSRPGHFDGVATIVTKLLNIVQPDRAYFGTKDAQQVVIVKELVSHFKFATEIVAVDLVREADRLAISSRNTYLTEEQRQDATALYKTLNHIRYLLHKDILLQDAIAEGKTYFAELANYGKLEYLEAYTYPDLLPITEGSKQIIIAIAAKFDKIRLIDNIVVDI